MPAPDAKLSNDELIRSLPDIAVPTHFDLDLVSCSHPRCLTVNKWTAVQIATIIDEVQEALSTLGPKHEACMSAIATDSDQYGSICKCRLPAIHLLIVDLYLCFRTCSATHSVILLNSSPAPVFLPSSYYFCPNTVLCVIPHPIPPTFGHFPQQSQFFLCRLAL